MIQTYKEWKVKFDGKKIVKLEQTDRKEVRISEYTAKTNNYYSNSTGLFYELVKEKPVKKEPIKK